MSSDESSPELENQSPEASPAIPDYSKEDEAGAVVVSATIVNDEEDDRSEDDNINDAESCSDEEVDVTMEEEDEDASIAYAVVVSAEVENDSGEEKKSKTYQKSQNEAEEEGGPTVSTPTRTRKRKRSSGRNDDGIPGVKDLGIPFRAIKRIMKIDPDIATVQNEAAMVTTYALELFVKKIVNESYLNAKKRGRNTVK
jgi:histone H3/H4